MLLLRLVKQDTDTALTCSTCLTTEVDVDSTFYNMVGKGNRGSYSTIIINSYCIAENFCWTKNFAKPRYNYIAETNQVMKLVKFSLRENFRLYSIICNFY